MTDSTELALAREFIATHPADVARLAERQPVAASSEMLAGLAPTESALVLEQMATALAGECLATMPAERAAAILAELPASRAAALLRRVSAESAQQILDAAPRPQLTATLRVLSAHPEGTAGALLDPTVLAVQSEILVGDALELIRTQPSHTFNDVYLVDRANKLVGVLNLRELMLAQPERPLSEVMHTDVECVRSAANTEEVVAHPGWREHHALPVIDGTGGFLGVIRYRTMRRLERTGANGTSHGPGVQAAVSLFELYWHALSGVIEGMTNGGARRAEKRDR